LLLGWCGQALAAQPAASPATFTGNATDGFQFATSEMEGTIRLDGVYHGVTRLIDKRSGRQVIDPRYSALNLFKLMSVNLMMGQPRQMERTIHSGPGWVEARWPATESHHGELVARYELCPPAAINLVLTVRARGSYAAYEVFMSNYFDKALRPHVWLKDRKGTGADLVLPTVNDVFRGTVLVFSRDAHAARRCLDGRWERNEFKAPTVQMCPVRHYGHCLALQADAENRLGVVLMADPRDCYALSTRYHADQDADRLTTYSAFDMSLFGDDLLPGQERTVKVRLALVHLDGDLSRALGLYREFLGAPVIKENKR
jgi:hypothetical protein